MSLFKSLLSLPYHVLMSMYAILGRTYSEKFHSFLNVYEKKYSKTHPNFYTQDYRHLISEMKQQLNMAIVYLHSDQHEHTSKFCKEILGDPQLIEFLQTRKIPFYIGPMHFPECYEVASHLNVSGFPFIALFSIANMRGTAKPTEIFRCEEFVSRDTLLQSLQAAVEKSERMVTPLRVVKNQLESERQIREMQDQAYLNSLKHDQEKKRKLELEKTLEQKKKDAIEIKREELSSFIHSRISRRKRYREALQSEPTEHVTQIQFKFPDGTRVKRCFHLTDTLTELYLYVDALDPMQEDMLDADGVQSKVETMITTSEEAVSDLERNYGFLLISMYPRKTLTDLKMTLEQVLGKHGAMVAVEIY